VCWGFPEVFFNNLLPVPVCGPGLTCLPFLRTPKPNTLSPFLLRLPSLLYRIYSRRPSVVLSCADVSPPEPEPTRNHVLQHVIQAVAYNFIFWHRIPCTVMERFVSRLRAIEDDYHTTDNTSENVIYMRDKVNELVKRKRNQTR